MPSSARRFPPHWTIEEHNDACFIVRDNTGQALSYFQTSPSWRSWCAGSTPYSAGHASWLRSWPPLAAAAGNVEPVIADQFLFHDGSPIPGAVRIARFAGARAATNRLTRDETRRNSGMSDSEVLPISECS